MQVPPTQEAGAKTAFITLNKTGEFTRIIFGLMNALLYFLNWFKYEVHYAIIISFSITKIFILIPDKNWPDLGKRILFVLEVLEREGFTSAVGRFLGFDGFFQRYVPKFSEITFPPHDLLKDDRMFKWTADKKNALTN